MTARDCGRWFAVLVAWLGFMGAPAGASGGVQHLVRPGDHWTTLADRVSPGDEIILMPGEHRAATFVDLRGTADNPIIIRGLDPEFPAVIEARRFGINLHRPQHLIIRDLTVTGASVAGITITADGHRIDQHLEDVTRRTGLERPPATPPAGNNPDDSNGENGSGEKINPADLPFWPAHITIENVTIEKTGPEGLRHAVRLGGVGHVTVRNATMRGWGGSAVKIIACEHVTVTKCTMIGLDDHGQLNGVQMRAGSRHIDVTDCLMLNVGLTGIAIGGASRDREFAPMPTDEPTATKHEAIRVRVSGNRIVGSETGVAFLNARRTWVRHNTIIDPTRAAYIIGGMKRADNVGRTEQAVFGSNMIVWSPGRMDRYSIITENAPTDGLTIEQNLWYSGEDEDQRARLGAMAGRMQWKQLFDVDPELDDDYFPRRTQALIYGARRPR